MLYAGVDIGGSSVKAALLRPDGSQTARSSPYRKPSLDRLCEAIGEAINGAGIHPDSGIARLGLCLPGRMDKAGRTVELSVNLPCLNGVEPSDLVMRCFGQDAQTAQTRVQIVAMSDGVAAAIGSHHLRPTSGRLAAIVLGTGVGLAVLDDGEPATIGGRGIGHLGQVDVGVEPMPLGPDGGRGGLEGYIGLRALEARFGDRIAEGLAVLGADDPIMLALARACRIVHAIYTPDEIRLLGGVGMLLEPVLPTLDRLVRTELTGVARAGWTISCADSAFLAAIGAAVFARDSAE